MLEPDDPVNVNALIPIPAETSPLLDQAAELANQGHFIEAIARCERHLRQKGLDGARILSDGDDLPGRRRPPAS